MKHPDNLRIGTRRWEITYRMFLSLFMTGMVVEMSQVGAGFIDGVIISRFLGPTAMAAEGVVHPLFSILGMVSLTIATGTQVKCAHMLGRGNKKDFSRFASAAIIGGAIISLMIMAAVLLLMDLFTAYLCSSENSADIAEPASKYLFGLGMGIPPLIVTAILVPAIQLDGGAKTIKRGALIEMVADIVLDVIAVKAGMGILGVGLATAVASYLNLLYQCTFFLKKDRNLHIVRPRISLKEFGQVMACGSERAIRCMVNTLCPIILNTVILFYGGSLAMAALSVRNNFSNFVEIAGAGIAAGVSYLTCVYYGEMNEKAIREVRAYGHRLILIVCGFICVIMFIFAKSFARIYVSGDGEILELTSFVIRMLALQIPLTAILDCRIKHLQATRRIINSNVLIVLYRGAFIILSAFVLGRFFGVYGILASHTVSSAVSIIVIYIYYAIRKRKLILNYNDTVVLPDSFKMDPNNIISLDIRNEKEAALASEQIMMFCKGHKMDRRTAYYSALYFEEMAVYILKNGNREGSREKTLIDLYAYIAEGTFVMSIRDNCPKLDILKKIADENEKESDPMCGMGIRVVSNTAAEINYMNTFNTNCLIITFELE